MESKSLCKHKESCVENAIKGLIKASLQGFAAKSCAYFVLNVLLRKGFKEPSKALTGFFTADAFKFTAFAGLMSLFFKSTLCALRKIRGKEDALNYMIAGSVGGLSIAVEDNERKETWSLYFAARMVDISLRAISKRTGGWDVNQVEVYLFMFMIFFVVCCYGSEKDNLIKSYYKFLDTLYKPSAVEKQLMNEWYRMSALKYPLR